MGEGMRQHAPAIAGTPTKAHSASCAPVAREATRAPSLPRLEARRNMPIVEAQQIPGARKVAAGQKLLAAAG
jgi:hypothetical protein